MSWVILIFLVLCATAAGAIWLWVKHPDRLRALWAKLDASPSLRFAVIAVLTLLMLIPLEFVDGVVHERSGRYQSVLRDISGVWGGEQRLVGPFVIVPYEYIKTVTVSHTRPDGEVVEREKKTTVRDRAVFLPEQTNLVATLDPEYRQRGIYRALIYGADTTITGTFAKPDLSGLPHTPSRIDWGGAYLTLGISDTRAINDGATLEWNGARRDLSPGTRYTRMLPAGLHAALPGLDGDRREHGFSLRIRLNGSGAFFVTPVAKSTMATIRSPWKDPSFQGSKLPTSRKIDNEGFSADWRVPHLARGFPQHWTWLFGAPKRQTVSNFRVGVKLFEPIGFYRATIRAVKYGILLLGMTFMAFYLFELTAKTRLGFVQYGLIGGALCLFYMLLISLSEHIGFFYAYLAASGAVVVSVSLYAWAALASARQAMTVFGLLAALYALLYVLLKQQDYALVLGTGMLFAVLIVAMYLTRGLNRRALAGAPEPSAAG